MRGSLLLIVLLTLAITGPATASGQDATPGASGAALASLGYPELLVRVIDEEFEMPETTAPAGRTLITLENAGEESWHGFLLRLPDDVTLATLEAATPVPGAEDAPPPWLFEATYPGFPGETLPGETNVAVVDLTPGEYLVVGDSFQPFEVVGDTAPPDAAAPPIDGHVDLFDFNFRFPATLAPGSHVWAISNSGEQPHELLLARSPEPVTAEQIMGLVAGESEEATPPGGGPSFGDLEQVGGIGWLTPGTTAWTEIDLAPGTYVALCFVPDPETFMPHVAMGMVAVFTVEAGTATPMP